MQRLLILSASTVLLSLLAGACVQDVYNPDDPGQNPLLWVCELYASCPVSGNQTTDTATETLPVTGAALWLKANAGVTTDSSNMVIGWADQSGNIVRTSSIPPPPTLVDGTGGQKTLRFESSRKTYIVVQEFMSFTEFTILIVGKAATSATSQIFYGDYGATGNQLIQLMANNGAGKGNLFTRDAAANFISTTGTTGDPTVYHIRTARLQSTTGIATGELFYNGTTDGSITNAVYNTATTWEGSAIHLGVVIGNHANPSLSNYLDGDISELIIYPSALASTDRQLVECYLSKKYGITVSHTCS